MTVESTDSAANHRFCLTHFDHHSGLNRSIVTNHFTRFENRFALAFGNRMVF